MVTSSTFIVNCAICPDNPTLELTRAFESMMKYEGADLPLSGFLP